MKLLLTSAGITNQSLADALAKMIGKKPEVTKIGFIPTAANAEPGDKGWFIAQLTNLQKFGFAWIDVVDIAAPGIEWKERLDDVDTIVMSGGNTFYLLDQLRKTGYKAWLDENLKTKVYVGISAGSIVVTPSIAVATIEPADRNFLGLTDLTGLSFVDFEISPHTPEHVSHENNKKYAQSSGAVLYGLDDQSGLAVIDGAIESVSEGRWVKY